MGIPDSPVTGNEPFIPNLPRTPPSAPPPIPISIHPSPHYSGVRWHPNSYGAPAHKPPSLHLWSQLSYNFQDLNNPDLVWDIIHPPDYARLCDRRHYKRYSLPDFDHHAINPKVAKAWVLSDHPVLAHWIDRWGHISIKSDALTMKDVLDGIYSYLRTPLTRQDISHLKSIPGNRESLRYARAHRAKESREVDSVVISQGYRRVDVLGGHRRFQGLRIALLPDNTWRIYLGLLPGPVPRVF